MLISNVRADSFDLCHWHSDPLLTAWIAGHLSRYGDTICDIGAGTGSMAADLANRFHEVILIEPSPPMLRRLKENVARMNSTTITVQEGEAESLPLGDASVDIALAKSSLHHFNNPIGAFTEMRRVARNAIGVVEVVLPHLGCPKCAECRNFTRKVLRSKESGRSEYTVFSETDLRGFLSPFAQEIYLLYFDQYIDIETWLTNSDLDAQRRKELYDFIAGQVGTIKEHMHIQFCRGRLMQLRHLALAIGVIK